MSKDINNMGLPLQKVIDLGEIDRWLREILPVMPRPTPAPAAADDAENVGYEVAFHDFNTHTMALGTQNFIEGPDIQKLVGFRKLLATCSQQNMRVDVSLLTHGAVEVAFNPDESFARSKIFGASYSNVLPVMFGLRAPAKK